MRQSQATFAIMALLLCARAAAQNLPDAGTLMRQIEQNTRHSQLQQAMSRRDVLPPAMVFSEDTLVQAQRFKFNGAKLMSNEQLQAVAAPFANRPLMQQDLQHLTHEITEAYRRIGWLVQAYIPRQDLKSDELIVQVIEFIPPKKSAQ